MNLVEAKTKAEQLIVKHCPEYSFEFDEAKLRFGCCRWKAKKITLSRHLVIRNDEERVTNTILHEIAHAMCGPRDFHNDVWKNKAKEIGCDGIRCYPNTVDRPIGKFFYKCPKCKRQVNRYKRIRKKTACGKCCKEYNHGKYSELFILKRIR